MLNSINSPSDDTSFHPRCLQAYDIPAMQVKLKLARANLPPRSIVRGPGYLQAVMVIEQVLRSGGFHHACGLIFLCDIKQQLARLGV